MAVDIVYKFRTPLEGHLLTKPFMGLSHEGWVHAPTVDTDFNSVTLSNISFFYAGRGVTGSVGDNAATTRLFHISSVEGVRRANLTIPDGNGTNDGLVSAAIGFLFPFQPKEDLGDVSEEFFKTIPAQEVSTFGGLILGRLKYINNKWHFFTDCVNFADKYFIDNKLEGYKVSLMPLKSMLTFSDSRFVIKHYNSEVDSVSLLLPHHPSGNLVHTELNASGGVDLNSLVDPLGEGWHYALGYNNSVSGGTPETDTYAVNFRVLGYGETFAEAINACLDPVSGVFNAPMAVVRYFSIKESVITQLKISSSPSSGSILRVATSSLASAEIKEVEGVAEPNKNTFVFVTFTKGNELSNIRLNIHPVGSGGSPRNIKYKGAYVQGGFGEAGRYHQNATILFYFDGTYYEQITTFLNRKINIRDDLTGTQIDDTEGNLTIPLQVEVPSETAADSLPGTGAMSLRSWLTAIRKTVAYKANNTKASITAGSGTVTSTATQSNPTVWGMLQDIWDRLFAINTKVDGKADTNHLYHVPTPQVADNAVFLRNDNSWRTVTPANIGAATPHSHPYASDSHTHTASEISGLAAATSRSQLFVSSGTWTAPSDVTSLFALFITGAGSSALTPGAGLASVSPGSSYAVTVTSSVLSVGSLMTGSVINSNGRGIILFW